MLVFLFGLGLNLSAQVHKQYPFSMERETFIKSLLGRMTLTEKVGQMNQYSGFYDATGPAPQSGEAQEKYQDIRDGKVGAILNVHGTEQVRSLQRIAVEETRLGIPMIFGYDVIHGYKTITPIPLAESASWNVELIQRSAAMAADEASAAGINWTFAPMVDISRDARWGRGMEGAGEDPFLGSKIAAARVHGFQGEALDKKNTIAACAKHFAAYGFVEAGREYNGVDIGMNTLYNTVLPPFKACVDAGIQTFMNSFTQVNGVPATADAFLQRELLKGDWDFNGFVVSDWASVAEMIQHGYAKDLEEAALKAVLGGCDMDMMGSAYVDYLEFLVSNNDVLEELINDAALRILRVKYNLGLFEDPYLYCDTEREKSVIGSIENNQLSRTMAEESIVLLKNEHDLLPLKPEGLRIGVIGHLAKEKNSPLGNWRLAAESGSAVSVWEGLQDYPGNTYEFEQGVQLFDGVEHFVRQLNINTTDTTGMGKAKELASECDIVVMVLGEHGLQSGEGRSRTDIGLPGKQQELLEAIYAINENVVLILMNGRPLAIEWADNNIPAILECWQLGTQSGHAIADVLYGTVNPSGKLPVSFPRSVGQVPIYYNYHSTGRPGPGNDVFWSHYTDEQNSPLYSFGYGLSYTDFQYSDLMLSEQNNSEIKVSVQVTNIGERSGQEVVQLYLQDQIASVARPLKELKGFLKLSLDPGQSQRVGFILGKDELGFFNHKGKYIVEDGKFSVMIDGLKSEFSYRN